MLPFAALVSVLLAQTATGRYDGVGAPRWFDAGFPPVLVVVQGLGGEGGALWLSGLDAGTSKTLPTGAVLPEMILGADTLGFSIGAAARVNQPGSGYHWAAVGAAAVVGSGRYLGDGLTAARFISTAPHTPELVLSVPQDIAEVGVLSEGTLPNGNLLSGGKDTGLIGLADGGYWVTRAGETNRAATHYVWLAFRSTPSALALAPYLGSGAVRSIGPLGFAPQWVLIGRQPGTNSMVHRPASVLAQDDLSLLLNLGAPAPNQITALEPSGFRLGTDARVNGGGQSYFYVAFGPGLDAGVPDGGVDAGVDAGVVPATDAGLDGGLVALPDGGADAGAPPPADGGATPPPPLGVGCGCGSAPASLLLLMSLAAARGRRARRLRTEPRP